ncbi:MAG: hypothetical protein K2X47_09555, partial [Bdellovibrionales bacterium]|nr:hypothetical protein [Bdellovibrionales bacterium]
FKDGFVLGDGLFDCNFLEAQQGTQVVTPLVPSSTNSFSHSLSPGANALIALCPRKNEASMQSAYVYPDGGSGGGGGPSGPYLRLEVQAPGGGAAIPTLTLGQCYPAAYKTFQSSSPGIASPYSVQGAVTIQTPSLDLSGSGSWFQLFSDSGCSTALGGSLPIAAGANQSAGFWIKPSVVGAGKGVSPGISTTGGEAISFSASTNLFNVGSPQLVVVGPAALVLSGASPLCYEFVVQRQDAAGFPINGGPAVSLQHNGTTGALEVFPTGYSDCINGIDNPTFGFAAGMSQSVFHVRRPVASGTGSLALTISAPSAPEYSNVTYNISGINGSPQATRFVVTADGPQEIGMCNRLKVTHVNLAGDEVPYAGANPVQLSFLPSATDVLFYGSQMCENGPSSIPTLQPGASRALVYYRSYQSTGFSMTVSGSHLQTIIPSGINLGLPVDPQAPYLTMNIPAIKSTLLGSHEFPKVIQLASSVSTTVTCDMSTDPTRSSWTPCTLFDATSLQLTWTAAQAAAGASGTAFRFRAQKGYRFSEYRFDPRQVYSKGNNTFEVAMCSVVRSPNGTTDFDILSSDLSGASNVICLNSGVFTGGAAALSISGNKKLIGITNAVGVPLTQVRPPGSSIFIDGDSSLSNIEFLPNPSASSAIHLQVYGSSGYFRSRNNIYRVNDKHVAGMEKIGAMGIQSVGDVFDVDGTMNGSFGIKFTCGSCGSYMNSLSFPHFLLRSSTGSNVGHGLYSYATQFNLDIEDGTMGSFKDGILLKVDDNGTPQPKTINIRRSQFQFTGPYNLNRYPIWAVGQISLSTEDTAFVSSVPQAMMKFVPSSPSILNLQLRRSRLVILDQAYAVSIQSSFGQQIVTTQTQFVRAGASGTGFPAVSASYSHSWNQSTSSADGTLFCGTTGTQFSSGADFTPIGFGFNTVSTTAVGVDSANLTCQ